MKPTQVNILGKEYQIAYCDNPANVDMYHRESLWGQIDFWTQTIRIYDNDRPGEAIIEALLHEILHGIHTELRMKCFDDDAGHVTLSLIAMALADVFTRNGWLKDAPDGQG